MNSLEHERARDQERLPCVGTRRQPDVEGGGLRLQSHSSPGTND